MKAETLKKSILQYAMQGKLVEQNPNDEPASELLKRIKAEKEQLIKDGKIKKEKSLPPITEDEIPYELPQGWEWVRFGNLVNYNIGRTPSRKEQIYWGNDIPWISIADMNNMGQIQTTKEKISKFAFEKCFKSTLVPKNTLIMSFKLTVGKVSILGIDALHNEAIISIFPLQDENFIIRNYLFHFLPLIAQTGNSKTAIKGNTLNTDSINNLLVPLPPLAEQQRIVEKLEEILPLVEEYGKNEEILSEMNKKLPKQIRQSILQYAIQGKLVEQNPNDEPASELLKRIKAEKEQLIKDGKIKKEKPLPPITEDEIPYELPQGWEWVRLGNITNITGGKRVPAGYQMLTQKTPYVYIRVTDMINYSIKDYDLRYISEDIRNKISRYIIKKDDLYLTIAGTIGRVGITPENMDNMNLTENAVRVVPYFVYNKFLMYALDSSFIQNQFIEKTNQLGQPKLALERIKTTYVPLPPLAEQQRIVTKVEELLNIVDKLKN